MSDIAVLASPDKIDLSRHGVIEAHAGTGKTHTIVHMVLRILEQTVPDGRRDEPYIHIREILLVTYTEKAAGELRQRIRRGIEARVGELRSSRGQDPLARHLESCLNNLHEAYIGTIHGICLRLLQTWPFETGVHFSTEMVDDEEGLESALRESMRTEWQDPATHIPWALERIMGSGAGLDERHFGVIRSTARELLDEEHAVLDRRATGAAPLSDLERLLAGDRGAVAANPLAAGFAASVTECIDVMRDIGEDPRGLFSEEILAEFRRRTAVWQSNLAGTIDPAAFAGLKTYGGGKRINTPKTRKHPLFGDLQACNDAVMAHLLLAVLRGETLPLALICDAAEILAGRWIRDKREKGLISFQDMLRLMHRAVRANPAFVNALRERLRYGIIDEFQDTSVAQWEIFRRIFVEHGRENGPRMFVVGDPKQSIYSFQGADVGSYLDAKRAIAAAGGRLYALETNFRSLPRVIDGYNAVIGRQDSGGAAGADWFESGAGDREGISYPAASAGGGLARAAARSLPAAHPLDPPPVQVMTLAGKAGPRRHAMAAWAAQAIRSLRGTWISVPDGEAWKDLRLDYEHFAVIVEGHTLARPFLDRFRQAGIPAVKYKMEGVFQSPMARDLHALLRAVLRREGDPAPRLAVLLTHFFNRRAENIDPDADLDPCADAGCTGDRACIAHALEEWTGLAGSLRWSQLFRRVLERTGVRERLMRLRDGERHLADLRQVIDYCMERLHRGNLSLHQLVHHLGRLLREEEGAGQDQNLHVLATDKSSVKVLTMHAAKGLEFPVVFVVTGGSRDAGKGPGTLVWIEKDDSGGTGRKHVVPFLSASEIRRAPAGGIAPYDRAMPQKQQERRRLLYVALTRAQAMLFVPLHLAGLAYAERDGKREIDWGACPPPPFPDEDLTPRITGLLSRKEEGPAVALFEPGAWQPRDSAAVGGDVTPVVASLAGIPDLRALDLPSRICRQTSYTQLSRQASLDREVDRSEEEEDPADAIDARARPALPGGSDTGDALHVAIEGLLREEDARKAVNDVDAVSSLIRDRLTRNGVFKCLAGAPAQAAAVDAAVRYVTGALTAPLRLPGAGDAVIADLPPQCRVPEMEFLLGVAPHWVHGFMDLVFRVENAGAAHPWRYYVLDWKSDQAEAYDAEHLDACITERHYDLQSKIYCHALDAHLRGILGDAYEPARNLGGAVYVFLRSFEQPGNVHAWTRPAEPEGDAAFVRACLRER